jgi:hypothetical protein
VSPTRRRSRSSPSLTTILIIAMVLVAFWVLRDRLGIDLPDQLPQPKVETTTRQAPGGDQPADNTALIKSLGGKVSYGRIDPKTGQRSGVTATIVPNMVEAASDDRLGTPADQHIRPPGFDALPGRNRARGHLLGRQLGGSGDLDANLVAMYQSRANSPVMRDYEDALADAVRDGQTVTYRVKPRYGSPTSKGAPVAVRLTAKGDGGFAFDVEIANTEAAKVKVFTPLKGAA